MPSSIKNAYVPITEINKLLIFCHTFCTIFAWYFWVIVILPFSSYHRFCICCCLVAKSCLTLCSPMAREAPLSIEFPRQEYWSGWPFLSPEDLPDPGIEPRSPLLQVNSLMLSHQESPPTPALSVYITLKKKQKRKKKHNSLKRAADCRSEGEIAESNWEQGLKMKVAHKG